MFDRSLGLCRDRNEAELMRRLKQITAAVLVLCFREPRDLRSRAARFENDDEAIGIANDTPYGLAAVILTGNLGRALRLADRIRAGTVWLNTWHRYHPTAHLAVI